MGIRDMFRRNKQTEEPNEEIRQSSGEDKKRKERRFSLMVEDVFTSSRFQGVMVIGNLYGRIRQGDTMYLYQKDKPVREVHVMMIELGPRNEVEMAKNQQVGLCLDLEHEDEVSKMAVLSNVLTEENTEGRKAENPRLLGMSMEYRRFYSNSVYMDELMYELCRAKFLLPLYIDRPPFPQPDGTLMFPEETQMGFRTLQKWDDKEQAMFPVFTDETALASWKDAFQKGQPKHVVVMHFPSLMEQVEKGHVGVVLNPYGPMAVYFPKELLDSIKNSEDYKQLYGDIIAN